MYPASQRLNILERTRQLTNTILQMGMQKYKIKKLWSVAGKLNALRLARFTRLQTVNI
jgi:hypothetical protein